MDWHFLSNSIGHFFSNVTNFHTFAGKLLWLSATGGVVVIVALAIQIAAIGKVKSHWLYLLWLLVLLRFILWLTPACSLSAWNLFESQAAVPQVTYSFDASEVTNATDFIDYSSLPFVDPTEEVVGIENNIVEVIATIDPRMPLVALWVTGFAFVSLRFIGSIRRAYSLIRRSRSVCDALQRRLESLQRRAGLRGNVQLRIADELATPAMFGLVSPVILMPPWCLDELSESELDDVLIHELVHVSRYDSLWQVAAQLVVAVHWFNPLTWLAARKAEDLRELSCDEKAVSLLSVSKNRTQCKVRYAKTILKIAARKQSPGFACVLRGFAGQKHKLVKQRIAMLATEKPQQALSTMILAGCVLLLLATGFTSAQDEVKNIEKVRPEPQQLVQNGAEPEERSEQKADPKVTFEKGVMLAIGESRTVDLSHDIPEIINEHPEIVSVVPLSPSRLRIKSRRRGTAFVQALSPEKKVTNLRISIVDKSESEVLAQPKLQRVKGAISSIKILVGQVKTIDLATAYEKLVLENSECISVEPVSSGKLKLTGRLPGTAAVKVMQNGNEIQKLEVFITPDLSDLRNSIALKFSSPEVHVSGGTDGNIYLRGQVEKDLVEAIGKFATRHSKLPIVNQLDDRNTFVKVKMEVYEISKKKMQNFKRTSPVDSDTKPFKSVRELVLAESSTNPSSWGMGLVVERRKISLVLEALVANEIATLLGRPHVTTIAGVSGKVDFGKDVSIASSTDGTPTTRYAGTSIKVAPHFLQRDKMVLEVVAESSMLVTNRAGSEAALPQFTVTRVNTGVELKYGQTAAFIGDSSSEGGMGEESTEILYLLTPERGDSEVQTTAAAVQEKIYRKSVR